jgi:hypothetical protein
MLGWVKLQADFTQKCTFLARFSSPHRLYESDYCGTWLETYLRIDESTLQVRGAMWDQNCVQAATKREMSNFLQGAKKSDQNAVLTPWMAR